MTAEAQNKELLATVARLEKERVTLQAGALTDSGFTSLCAQASSSATSALDTQHQGRFGEQAATCILLHDEKFAARSHISS